MQWSERIVWILTVFVAFWKAGPSLRDFLRSAGEVLMNIRNLARLAPLAPVIANEFRKNGGSSLKDQITLIHAATIRAAEDAAGAKQATLRQDGVLSTLEGVLEGQNQTFERNNRRHTELLEEILSWQESQTANTSRVPFKGQLLLVEDEGAARRVLQLLLIRKGWQVTAVGGVADAINGLKPIIPDVIVLDMMLPDGSGIDILKAVKEQELPCCVVVVTGTVDHELIARVKDFKPHGLLFKPVTLSELLECIDKRCEHKALPKPSDPSIFPR